MLTVTAKGPVTLRKEVVEHLGVGPGDRMVEVRANKGAIAGFFGLLARPEALCHTVDDMNRIAADGWAG